MLRRVSRWAAAWLACLLVTACGGGGESAGTPVLGGGGGTGGGTATPTAADVVLVLSAPSVATNGSETVVATVTAIDANRNALSGIPVTISVNANAIATPSGTRTGTQGTITANIGIGSDRTARTVTVTATSGSVTRTATLDVRDAGGTGSVASDLILVLSSSSIANNGTQTVTASATALDARRNVLPGTEVSLSVDANALLMASGPTTNASGVVTGTVGIGSDSSNRMITVTARSGTLTRTAQLQVTNAVVAGTAVASDLSLSLSAPRLNNGGTSTVTATVTAVDANRNALGGIPVTVRVDSSAVASVSGTITNTQGQVTAAIGIGADRSNRVVTVTATSGTITRTASFTVDGAELKASFSPRVNSGSIGNQIEYTLLDTNGLPMVGQPISVTAPGLPGASGSTDLNGKFTYSYTAPSANLVFTATAAGATRQSTVEVGSGTIDPAPAVPQSASVTPSPSVVTVNAGGSNANQVELRALFYGSSNQPIPRVRVRFDLDGNATSSDGVITWLGGDYAYSDANGAARATFTPGQRSSPTNGVSVRICYDTADFPTSSCPNERRATLTVTQEALAVNIRTNELIKEGAAKLTYIKEFVVMVVDSAGQAKPDILITPSVDLPSYYKGVYVWDGTRVRWVQTISLSNTQNYSWDDVNRRWVQGGVTAEPQCPNEDVNRNGVREAARFDADPAAVAPVLTAREEDLNWNGDLDPRKSDVAIKMVGSAKTDANGLAVVQIEYGKSLAGWVDFIITVTASGISGTEARARYSGLAYGLGNLPADADSLTNEKVTPAYAVSPYGRSSTCQDAR
ncbi:MAG: Ig-like domain-containing protein [Rubrivivax sp.]|nr:Ig-like domain-containing protein [Rubrivivax sp.]